MKTTDIETIRAFNRFYTNVLGLVNNHILKTDFSLPEARVLYELSKLEPCSANRLIDAVMMDKGYLSRLLRSFEQKGIVSRQRDRNDGRASRLMLTQKGRSEIRKINAASAFQIRELLSGLSAREVKEVITHMERLKILLSKSQS